MQYVIIVAKFNEEITKGLLKGALKAFQQGKVPRAQIKVVEVPGSWEIPIVAQLLARAKKYHAIVTLGAVIKGGTTHDYWINHAIFPALQEVAEEYMIPVTLGIITCNTWRQALTRSRGNALNRGFCAAQAALRMVQVMKAHRTFR